MRKIPLILLALNLVVCKSKNLHEASTSGRPEEVKSFIKAGANVNERDYKGRTPLIVAARRAGKQVITGAEVIALQAAEQFERYTGVRPTAEQVAEASAYSRA